MIEESESAALEVHLASSILASSRIAIVEVLRATSLANPAPAARAETERLLASLLLLDADEDLLRAAAAMTSATVRTLDAIHLASALRIGPDEFVAYDRRLAAAAASRGLTVASPDAEAADS